ncbi:hypothetical protein Tco_0833729 [Tanacetum coccineum]
MSLDDLYNHLKVYEPEVQKKAGSNSQNMAFISSSNTSSGKGEVPTASISTASSQVSTISTEMDIKWNLALLSMRANRFWKKTESQKSAKDKTSVGFNEYSVVPPPPAQVYSPPKKDLFWMGLPEFVDDTVTDYSRPTPSIDVPRDLKKPTCAADLGNKEKLLNLSSLDLETKATLMIRIWDMVALYTDLDNISDLSEYEPYDGGYVSFGHGGGKITGKIVTNRFTLIVLSALRRSDTENRQDQAKMETPRSSGVNSPPNAHT